MGSAVLVVIAHYYSHLAILAVLRNPHAPPSGKYLLYIIEYSRRTTFRNVDVLSNALGNEIF